MDANSISLENASREDVEAITAIYNDAILNTTAVYSYDPVSVEDRLAWFDTKTANDFPVFVAKTDDQAVGFSTYGPFRAWPAYLYTVEHSVYVGANHRRRGIGQALLEKIITEAAARKLHTLIGGIDADNTASLKLHQKVGFEPVAHFKQVGFKFNRWLDLVFMQKFLSDS